MALLKEALFEVSAWNPISTVKSILFAFYWENHKLQLFGGYQIRTSNLHSVKTTTNVWKRCTVTRLIWYYMTWHAMKDQGVFYRISKIITRAKKLQTVFSSVCFFQSRQKKSNVMLCHDDMSSFLVTMAEDHDMTYDLFCRLWKKHLNKTGCFFFLGFLYLLNILIYWQIIFHQKVSHIQLL